MRAAEAADAPAVAGWAAAAGFAGWSEASVASALAVPATVAVVAEGPDGPIGALMGRYTAETATLDLLVVAEPARRRGVGRTLLEAWLGALRRLGARVVDLEVAPSNRAARALYDAFEFVEAGRRARYYASGEDALILVRTLPPRVEAVILAGGRARRLGGRAKPLVRRPDGLTLIEAVRRSLAPHAARIWVSAPRRVRVELRRAEPSVWSLPAVEDPGEGPGVAVRAALPRLGAPWVLWTVADLAAPDSALWGAFIDRATGDVEAVLARVSGIAQPGCVLARRDALARAEGASLQGLLRGLRTRVVDSGDLAGPARASLRDVDTPRDLRRLVGRGLASPDAAIEDPSDAP